MTGTSGKSKKLIIKEEFCKECGICIHFCPRGCLRTGSRFNSKGYHPVECSDGCSLCGICYTVCPDFAIEIVEDEKADQR